MTTVQLLESRQVEDEDTCGTQ